MAKPASKISLIIWLMTISELELRMEKRFRGILRALSNLSRFRRSEQSDGQWKSKCWRSQILSVVCRVHIGESFRPSLCIITLFAVYEIIEKSKKQSLENECLKNIQRTLYREITRILNYKNDNLVFFNIFYTNVIIVTYITKYESY